MKIILIIILLTSCATVRPTYDNYIPFPMSAAAGRVRAPDPTIELSPEQEKKKERNNTLNSLFIGAFLGLVIIFFVSLYEDYAQ